MLKSITTLLTIISTLSGTAIADTKFTPGNHDKELPYQLHKPTIETGKQYPLILFLHGAGERGSNNTSQLREPKLILKTLSNITGHSAFIVAPQCPKDQWWSGDNLINAIELTKQITKQNPIDKKRIYITGISMGGFGTWSALATEPKLFAAAIPICGGGNPETAKQFKHVPIQAYHGDADKTVTPDKSQTMVDALKKAKAKHATLTLYPGVAHNSWTQTYKNPEVLTWLFSQKKK